MPNTYVSYNRNTKVRTDVYDRSTITARDDYKSGEVIEISCLPGYNDPLMTHAVASCIGSEWQYNKIACERKSSQPLQPLIKCLMLDYLLNVWDICVICTL